MFIVGKPERKTPLGRTRRRWVDNIRIDLRGEFSVYDFGWETGGKETAGET
jgi:hypothetical protein